MMFENIGLLYLPASFLPLGSTHLSKPVGPGQSKKSVDKLKCVNAVGLGLVNPLSHANQLKRSPSGKEKEQERWNWGGIKPRY